MFSTLLLFVALSVGSQAEHVDTTVSKRVSLDEITVTEFKRNRHNLTPSSITTVSSQFLSAQELTGLKDLTAVMPNFFMPDYGSRQNAPVYIRGVGAKTKAPAVGFYVDGVPHFENSAFDIDLSDIAHVEICRGPQGTLYGRNAIGGIISVHTHSPLDYQGTRIKVGYGNKNDVTAQFAHYAKLSSSFGFSVAGGYHHHDGFYYNETTGKMVDNIDNGFGRLSFVWKPTPLWTLRLNSMLDYSDQGGYPYGAYHPETGVVDAIRYNRKSVYRRLISTTGFNARYTGKNLSFNSQTSYQYIKDRQGIDQDFTPQETFFVINQLGQQMLSQEFTLKSNHDSPYQWIVGAFGMVQDIYNTVETQKLREDIGTPANYAIPIYAGALYHQSSYNIWKGLSVTAGLRFDYEYARLGYRKDQYKLSTGDGWETMKEADNTLRFKQLTPKLALQYLTENRHLYYVSMTRGYKAGGFNQTFLLDEDMSFGPEYNWNYEVGAKLNFWQRRLMAEVALFYIDWRHQHVNQTIPGVGNVLHNAGHSDSKGVEVSLTARPVSGLDVQLSYGYTYARFLDYKKSEKLDYSGMMLPMVPRHTLGVHASYALVPVSGSLVDRLVFSAGLSGVGKIYWAEDNAVSQPFYALLNAKVSATRGIFTWEIWGKNLTDTNYQTYNFKSSAYFAQKGKPLSFGTSLVVKF